MHELDRVKLLGQYRTPPFKYGDTVICAIRGPVEIVGLSNGLIPWPKCRSTGPNRAIILYGDLADAVRRESVEAVKHWFGVGGVTVWRWRKALGVEFANEGTSALFSRWAPETYQSEAAKKVRATSLKSPERAAKIAAAMRGKPQPRHVIEAMRQANLGRKATAEQRQKMSESHKARGTRPPAVGVPWTASEDALLGTMVDREIAERTGRTEHAVRIHRFKLGVPAFTKRAPRSEPFTWTPAKDRLLGTMPDGKLAHKLRCQPMAVFYRRKQLKIAAYRG
jgi:hypothetical protein